MVGSTKHLASIERTLRPVLGKRIRGIFRVWYDFQGELDKSDGPIELDFSDDSVLVITGQSDGESLKVSNARWRDPFEPPISRENEDYISQYGRWRRVSVSDEEPYKEFVGRSVAAIDLLENQFGRLAGAGIIAAGGSMYIVVEGDEDHVYFGQPIDFKIIQRLE